MRASPTRSSCARRPVRARADRRVTGRRTTTVFCTCTPYPGAWGREYRHGREGLGRNWGGCQRAGGVGVHPSSCSPACMPQGVACLRSCRLCRGPGNLYVGTVLRHLPGVLHERHRGRPGRCRFRRAGGPGAGPVLVSFLAERSGHRRLFEPVLHQGAAEFAGRLAVGTLIHRSAPRHAAEVTPHGDPHPPAVPERRVGEHQDRPVGQAPVRRVAPGQPGLTRGLRVRRDSAPAGYTRGPAAQPSPSKAGRHRAVAMSSAGRSAPVILPCIPVFPRVFQASTG